ncbi:mitochondrial nucleoid-associated protein 1 [Ctenodactylus gundi]
MGDPQPRMQVCPYCKKPFKRLKTHLPHCKMVGPATPMDQELRPSQLPTHPQAKKVTELFRDLVNGREFTAERKKGNTKLKKGKPEGTVASIPQEVVGSEGRGASEARQDTEDQNQLSFGRSECAAPESPFQGGGEAQLQALDGSSERELAQDVPAPGERRRDPSGRKVTLLAGPVEPSVLNQDRKFPSAAGKDAQATLANLRLDPADPQRQRLPVRLLDVPVGDCHLSPGNPSDGRVRAAALSKEQEARGRGSGDAGGQEKNSESRVLSILAKSQVKNREKELSLEPWVYGSKGNANRRTSRAGMLQRRASGSHSADVGSGDPAAGRTSSDLSVFMLQKATSGELLSPSPPSPFSQGGTTDTKLLPYSVGLEWFPELYSSYLGLGLLPGRPQYWNPMAQKPQLTGSQGGRLPKGWIRSSSAVRKSGPGGVTMLFVGCVVLCCSWSFRQLSEPRPLPA